MELVELGKVSKIISGSTPSRRKPEYFKGNIHWFTPKDLGKLESKTIEEAPEKITKEGYNSCSTTLLPAFSVLFTCRAPIGHLAINLIECCTNQGFKSVVPNKSILDVNYLYYYLKKSVPEIQNLGRGATFKELSKNDFSKFKIPLPNLETQKRIATILDEADTLRQLNKQLIAKYNKLTQSLFLDMFGDPVTNPKGWEKVILKKLTSKIGSGSTPRGGKEGYFEEGISLIRSLNVYDNKFKYKNLAFISENQADKLKNVIVKEKDVLFNITGASICRSTIVPKDVLPARVNQHVSILRPLESKLNSLYLNHFLISENIKNHLLGVGSGGGAVMQAITKQQLTNLEITLPPIHLQNQFAERVQLIEQQKQQAQDALQKSELLFNSLLQKAFNGTL